jgi:rhodanese-related sulfurtransferase
MVKGLFQQCAIIVGLSATAAVATYLIKPPPPAAARIVCDPAALANDEICLQTVIEAWHNDCIWVDARRRVDWEKDGLPGSILLTTADGESFDRLLEQAFPVLAEKQKRVVVYCNDVGCGTSREIAKRLRDYQLVPEVRALHGGWKALSEAGMIPPRK